MRRGIARATAALGLATALVAPFAVMAGADPVATPNRVGSLVAVGPISGDHGFPVWYQDSTKVGDKPLRLEACLDPKDVVCPIPAGTVPNPDAPLDLRAGNFPVEFFYQLAGSTLTLPGGGDVVLTLALEGAFANGRTVPGDQIVFGRTRYVIKGAQPNATYTFRQPWGVDEVTTDASGGVRYVDDVGLNPGVFTAALGSRVGPFLRWDATGQQPPPGYVGVLGIPHTVTGSGIRDEVGQLQNYFRVTDPNGREARNTLFDIQGKIAANSGVDAQQVTYATTAAGATSLEVFATSDPGSALQVYDVAPAGAPRRFARTVLAGDSGGRYYGNLAMTGKPETVEVVNVGDNPVSKKPMKVVDRVTVTEAAYAFDAAKNSGSVTVAAISSDEAAKPALTVTGFGPLGAGGSRTFTNVVAPPLITVTSAAGGSVTVPVTTSGDKIAPVRPTASAGALQSVQPGQAVTLDASLSDGDIDSYRWQQLTTEPNQAPVTLSDPAVVRPTFTAPTKPGDLFFQVTVAGPGGTSTAQVTVTVNAAQPPVVKVAQSAISAQRGGVVTLDASASTGISTYTWTQKSGPAVTLANGTTAKPTFTLPFRRVPGQGAVVNTTTDLRPLVFELVASGPSGSAAPVTITVTPTSDVPAIQSAEFRTKGGDWRVSGTSSILAGQRVAVVLGSTAGGTFLGFADVDATGAWAFRGTTAAPAANVTTVSVVSALGGQQLGFAFRRK